jgi:hypothetical protein
MPQQQPKEPPAMHDSEPIPAVIGKRRFEIRAGH